MIVMVIIVITMIATCYGDEDDKSHHPRFNEISLHLKCSSQLVSDHLVVPVGQHVLSEPEMYATDHHGD